MPSRRTHSTSSQAAADSIDSGREEPPQPRRFASAGAPLESASVPEWLDVQFPCPDAPGFDRDWLARSLRAVGEAISVRHGRPIERLSVLVADDARMIELHQRHMGVAEPTDVLTFDNSAARASAAGPIDADIVICMDEARRRADELGHGVERELLLYAVHGLLHCIGFDDHDEAAHAAMHAEEDAVLESIGVGAVYRPAQRNSGSCAC